MQRKVDADVPGGVSESSFGGWPFSVDDEESCLRRALRGASPEGRNEGIGTRECRNYCLCTDDVVSVHLMRMHTFVSGLLRTFVCLVTGILGAWGTLKGETVSITLLYTSDVHARLLPDREGRGGWANIASYFQRVRRESKEAGNGVLVLDAGDMIQGTAVSSLFQGKPIFEVMNAARYDVAVLGNHEFDLGAKMVAEYREIANFPLLAANVRRNGRPVADAPTAVFSLSGVRLGIVGISTSEWVYDATLNWEEPARVVQRHLEDLCSRTDLVVVLSHLGIERDRLLAEAVPEVALILGGHSHITTTTAELVGHTRIVQAGALGHFVGRLDIEYDLDADALLAVDWQLVPVPVAGLEPDPATSAVVDHWEGKVADAVNVVIGENARFLERNGELRDLIGAVWKKTFDADFGYQNYGANLQDLHPGPIRIRDFYEIMPWGNTLAVVVLAPEQVREVLGEVAFKDEKTAYRVVTNSFVARQLVQRFALGPDRVNALPVIARDPVIEYVRSHGSLLPAGSDR